MGVMVLQLLVVDMRAVVMELHPHPLLLDLPIKLLQLNQHTTRMEVLQVHRNNQLTPPAVIPRPHNNSPVTILVLSRVMDSKVMISKVMANRVITVGHNNLQRLHLPMDMDTRNKEEHNRTTVVGTVTSNDSSWQWSSLLGGSFGRCFRDFINLPRILKISVNLMGTCCFYTDR